MIKRIIEAMGDEVDGEEVHEEGQPHGGRVEMEAEAGQELDPRIGDEGEDELEHWKRGDLLVILSDDRG